MFPAEYLHDREALVYSVGSSLRAGEPTGPGYNVFTPARLLNGAVVMVNRGFVSEARRDPATRADGQIAGTVNVLGVIRWPDPPSMVTPAADPGRNLWFARDPTAIAAAKGLEAAPFYIEQEFPLPAGGWPLPARPPAELAEQSSAICDHVVRPRRSAPSHVHRVGGWAAPRGKERKRPYRRLASQNQRKLAAGRSLAPLMSWVGSIVAVRCALRARQYAARGVARHDIH